MLPRQQRSSASLNNQNNSTTNNNIDTGDTFCVCCLVWQSRKPRTPLFPLQHVPTVRERLWSSLQRLWSMHCGQATGTTRKLQVFCRDYSGWPFGLLDGGRGADLEFVATIWSEMGRSRYLIWSLALVTQWTLSRLPASGGCDFRTRTALFQKVNEWISSCEVKWNVWHE